jgi:hypothetical protein
MGREIFASWEQRDIEDLVRLTRKFANDINGDRPMIRGTPNDAYVPISFTQDACGTDQPRSEVRYR